MVITQCNSTYKAVIKQLHCCNHHYLKSPTAIFFNNIYLGKRKDHCSHILPTYAFQRRKTP